MHVTQVCETSSSSHHSQDCLTRRDRDMSSVPTSVPSRRGSAPVCFFEGSISGLRPIPVQSDTLDHIKVSASPSDRCQLASVSLLCASMPSEQGVAALPMLRAVNINDLALDTTLYYAADLSYVVVATVGGNQMQGLRSRRPSAHRRNADRDEDVAHPLRPSPSLSTVAVGALTDDTVTRPLLRRWLSQSEDTDLWNGDVSNGNIDGFDDGEAEANNESEVLVIEHTVSHQRCLWSGHS